MTFVKDQNGTVFSDLTCLTEQEYRQIQGECSLFPPYEEIPSWDSRQSTFKVDNS